MFNQYSAHQPPDALSDVRLPPKADMTRMSLDVRYVPETKVANRRLFASLTGHLH
jgi:hypothetical protein